MTECDEVAAGLLPGYLAWLAPYVGGPFDSIDSISSIVIARHYVYSQMPGENKAVIENVASCLYHRAAKGTPDDV